MNIRNATLDDIEAVKRIASKYRNELGRVIQPMLRDSAAKGELLVADSAGGIVGFCRWYKRRDGISVIYEIAVHPLHKGAGIGRALADAIPGTIRLKCTVDNPANEFYARLGFAHIGTEDGRKRKLNVWQRLSTRAPDRAGAGRVNGGGGGGEINL